MKDIYFQTIFIYSLVLIVLFICGRVSSARISDITISHKFNYWENWIPIIFFSLIFGLRYDVGEDYLEYMHAYNAGGSEIERYEPIFRFVTSSFRDYGIHYFWYFALWAFIQISLIYYALKDEKYLMPFFAISFITGEFFLYWMNTIRQSCAECIFFFSIVYIVDKKFVKYLLCCLLAIGFHKSSLILIPLYPILVYAKDLTFNRFIQIVIYTFAFIIALSKIDVLGPISPYLFFLEGTDYAVYSENVIESFYNLTSVGNGIAYKMMFVINIIIILYSQKLKNYFCSRRFTICYNLYFWGAVVLLMLINNLVLNRPFRYFRLFNMIMIAYMLYYLYKHGKSKLNSLVFIILLIILFLLLIPIFRNYPFKFIWDT